MRKAVQIARAYGDFIHELSQNNYRNFLITGGRGSAKSFTTGLGLLGIGGRERSKIICTRQIQNSIKDSVHSLLKNQINEYELPFYDVGEKYIGNTMTGSQFLFTGMYRNINNVKSIPGLKYAWLEEAQDLSQESIDVIGPTIREPQSKLIYTLNPAFETDPVWDTFMKTKRPDTFYLHTTIYDNPFASDDLLAEAELLKKMDYRKWLHVYMGELRQEGDDLALSVVDVNKAMERTIKAEGMREHGVDCARYGDDSSVIGTRHGMKMTHLKIYDKKNVTQLAGLVMKHVGGNKQELIKVDVGGLGAGVYDILKSEGYNAIECNFGAQAKNPDRYANMIGEMWHEFCESLDQMDLIENSRLKTELTTRKYEVDPKGRYKIESKDKYKKRGYKSPDVADAVLLTYYTHKKSGYFTFT